MRLYILGVCIFLTLFVCLEAKRGKFDWRHKKQRHNNKHLSKFDGKTKDGGEKNVNNVGRSYQPPVLESMPDGGFYPKKFNRKMKDKYFKKKHGNKKHHKKLSWLKIKSVNDCNPKCKHGEVCISGPIDKRPLCVHKKDLKKSVKLFHRYHKKETKAWRKFSKKNYKQKFLKKDTFEGKMNPDIIELKKLYYKKHGYEGDFEKHMKKHDFKDSMKKLDFKDSMKKPDFKNSMKKLDSKEPMKEDDFEYSKKEFDFKDSMKEPDSKFSKKEDNYKHIKNANDFKHSKKEDDFKHSKKEDGFKHSKKEDDFKHSKEDDFKHSKKEDDFKHSKKEYDFKYSKNEDDFKYSKKEDDFKDEKEDSSKEGGFRDPVKEYYLKESIKKEDKELMDVINWPQGKVKPYGKGECTDNEFAQMRTRMMGWFHLLHGQDHLARKAHGGSIAKFYKHVSVKKELRELDGVACNCMKSAMWFFRQLDKSDDNHLTDEELTVMEDNSLEPCMNPYLKSCDTSGDQKLSDDEWCCCFTHVLAPCFKEIEEIKKGNDKKESFIPRCDREGYYMREQCQSKGEDEKLFCWCVDMNGNELEGTATYGRAHCSKLAMHDIKKTPFYKE